jgi:DNA-3-methyladenine glycosylase II
VQGNPVDVVSADGRYLRALRAGDEVSVIEVRQPASDRLAVRIGGRGAPARLPVVATMLGVNADLREWCHRVKPIPWLARLAAQLCGLRPPRYPDLWEALCHAIVFQQLSIAAGAAIMDRFVRRFSAPVDASGVRLYPFPCPRDIARAPARALHSVGLSRMKAAYLRTAAHGVLSGAIDEQRIAALPSEAALDELQALPGIGRWSAAVVLLRGFGRLDVFPPKDSGASRSMKLLSSNPAIDADDLLDSLNGVRGMLYFHLLLGTLYGLLNHDRSG